MQQVAWMLVAILLIVAAVLDLRSYVIPNWLTLGVGLVFALLQLLQPPELTDLLLRVAAAASMTAIGLLLFARNLFGGGDVKLIAALALWLGFANLPRFLLLMSLSGGLLALTLLVVRWWRSDSNERIDHRVPYGVAIAIAGLDFCFQQQHVYQALINLI